MEEISRTLLIKRALCWAPLNQGRDRGYLGSTEGFGNAKHARRVHCTGDTTAGRPIQMSRGGARRTGPQPCRRNCRFMQTSRCVVNGTSPCGQCKNKYVSCKNCAPNFDKMIWREESIFPQKIIEMKKRQGPLLQLVSRVRIFSERKKTGDVTIAFRCTHKIHSPTQSPTNLPTHTATHPGTYPLTHIRDLCTNPPADRPCPLNHPVTQQLFKHSPHVPSHAPNHSRQPLICQLTHTRPPP